MEIKDIGEYARALYQAHGDKAEAEAQQKMREAEAAGNTKEAEDWKAIRQVIHEMRGPNQG